MSILNQKTVRNPIDFCGVGLHSGKMVKMTVRPSEPDTGIVFKRIDLKSKNLIFPSFENVVNTSLNTTISNEYGVTVSTIEHLMGALFGLGVDNAIIEIDNNEVPILDGSAIEFINKITSIGLQESDAPIKIIKINKKVEFSDGERLILIEPSKLSLDIDFAIKFKTSVIGRQKNKINVYEDDLSDVFSSRTFCLYEDIEHIKNQGLAKGGSLDNAIVVKDNEILNEDGLRNRHEFVYHKILDCLGDLMLSGHRLFGHVKTSRGGHALTNKLLIKFFSDSSNWSIEKESFIDTNNKTSIDTKNPQSISV